MLPNRNVLPLVALLAATAAAYLPGIDGDFVVRSMGLINDHLVSCPRHAELA